MIARPTRTDVLLLGLLGIMWGSSYAFIKLGVQTLPTFTLIAARLAIGLMLLVTVVVVSRAALPRNPKTYLHLFVMAAINIVIPFTLITTAEKSVASNIAAILNGSVPLIVIVLAALVFHDEPITLNRLAGIVIGYVGVIVLVAPGLLSGSASSAVSGEIALVGSTIAYAIGAVYSRLKLRGLGLAPVIPAVFQVGFALVMIGTLSLVLEKPFAVAWNTDALVAVVWLGLIGSGLAYLVQFRLLTRIGATATSQVAYLLPVVGLISGALMFGEVIDAQVLIGTALILGGVALVNAKFGERRVFGRAAPVAAPAAGSGPASADPTAEPAP
ncbi:MAG TPA: DMT family transporter [Candidatus Binatus sp.]|nr:DMT family transporter [Candidatus Binatus sp.]